MTTPGFRALIVGVGGQGVLTAAQILGAAAHAAALPVVVGQLHGMSQRGGSVQCSVVIGGAESSFAGEDVDVLIAYEPLEALRALDSVGPRTRVLLNRGTMLPFEVVLGGAEYPPVEQITAQLRAAASSVIELDAAALFGPAGEGRALNVLLLGAAAGLGLFPIPEPVLRQATLARCGARFRDANARAFDLGREAVGQRASPAS